MTIGTVLLVIRTAPLTIITTINNAAILAIKVTMRSVPFVSYFTTLTLITPSRASSFLTISSVAGTSRSIIV